MTTNSLPFTFQRSARFTRVAYDVIGKRSGLLLGTVIYRDHAWRAYADRTLVASRDTRVAAALALVAK